MKKFKKIFAVLLTLAMVLGMGMTSFAASTDKGSIIINGLATGTQINAYKFISLNEDNNEWTIEGWAEPYVSESEGKYTITDAAGLKDAVPETATFTDTATGTTYNKENVEIGAYLILATASNVTYTPMVADVAAYGTDGLITGKVVTITAKTSGYTTGKEASDNFVARGEEVTFTITTTFPTFDYTATGNSYKIVDKPTGLDITSVESVKIGGTVISGITGSLNELNEYVIDLTSQINADNAGKPVEVIYKATVTADNGYSNSANAYRNDEKLGETDTVVEGYTGSITVRKIEANTENVLKGAEFQVSKVENGVAGEALFFVSTGVVGEYKLADSSEEGASQTIVATNGTVKVKGLDEGTYHFTETKAPEGYSVAQDVMEDAVITVGDANVDLSGEGYDYPNTRLSSLPGTGGIGTTIFTIGGCAIMIIAAALFFASRRKSAK